MFLRSASLFAALFLCISTPAWAQTPVQKAPALKAVTVNGKPIPKARLDFIAKQRAAQGQPDNEQARKAILDNLITQEVVAQEADRRGFLKSADVRAQLELVRQQVLVQAIVQEHLKTHPIKDEEMLAEYNKVKALRGDKEYKLRHILVDKDSEANEIIAQLKKGTKFEDLAKQSKDPGSKDKEVRYRAAFESEDPVVNRPTSARCGTCASTGCPLPSPPDARIAAPCGRPARDGASEW